MHLDKFQGYSYGQRPLGISFAKYPSQGGDESMEGQESSGHLQAQMM